MDIQATIDVDMDIETERNDAMIKATNMLVTSLTRNGDIPKNTEDKCMCHVFGIYYVQSKSLLSIQKNNSFLDQICTK